PPRSTLFPYTTLFRSGVADRNLDPRAVLLGDLAGDGFDLQRPHVVGRRIDHVAGQRTGMRYRQGLVALGLVGDHQPGSRLAFLLDRKSTRLNSSHVKI